MLKRDVGKKIASATKEMRVQLEKHENDSKDALGMFNSAVAKLIKTNTAIDKTIEVYESHISDLVADKESLAVTKTRNEKLKDKFIKFMEV